MGHYASEMGDSPRRNPNDVSGYENKDVINEFFGDKPFNANSSCPRCGAKLEWNWVQANDLLLHIKWHKNLASLRGHQSAPYPGLPL